MAGLLLMLLSTDASAQQPQRFQVSGGYSFLSGSGLFDGHAAGWAVGGGWNASKWLALGIELSRNSHRQDVGLLDVGTSFVGIHAGPRVSLTAGRLRPFVQVLVGQTQADFEVRSSLLPTSVGTAFDERFSWQLGGGVDLDVEHGFAVRLAYDYRRISTIDTLTQHRVLTALVYGFP